MGCFVLPTFFYAWARRKRSMWCEIYGVVGRDFGALVREWAVGSDWCFASEMRVLVVWVVSGVLVGRWVVGSWEVCEWGVV